MGIILINSNIIEVIKARDKASLAIEMGEMKKRTVRVDILK